MKYPETPNFRDVIREIEALAKLKTEYGSTEVSDIIEAGFRDLQKFRERVAGAAIDRDQEEKEPNDLPGIRQLRADGPRRIWTDFDEGTYRERLEGSILARSAGCTLGAIVEGWSVDSMRNWAKATGHSFPPTDYWPKAGHWLESPSYVQFSARYGVDSGAAYTRDGMDGVPVDDDLVYTQLGLLLFEKYGRSFTTEQVGRMWHEYLNWIYIDMEWPLNRLLAGAPVETAADGNPWEQMICAFIRCDPYGYVAPGLPELAAEFSHRDGLMSHRRNGLYGGMFFAASIAAAFTVDDPIEAVKTGLTEIPADSELAKDIRWALEIGPGMRDYADARAAVDERFGGMYTAHTLNNACLVVFGLCIGGTDVTRVISETVAMGLDNDCTAATAGSIVGAVVGKRNVPQHWYRGFNDTMRSYIRDHPTFRISDMVERYTKQAAKIWSS